MRLLLLRHAKSSWDDPTLSDIDRSLNARGRAAAITMAKYVQEEGFMPSRILCSTAQRTRETLAKLLQEIKVEAEIHLISDLYQQSEIDYIGQLQAHGGRAPSLMVIGHNPATQQTALDLIGSGDQATIASIQTKYPSGALTVIDFDIVDWSEVRAGTGHLHRFVKPRELRSDPE